MNTKLTFSFVSTVLLVLGSTALVIKSDPAIAQQSDEELEEIVVETPAFATNKVRIGKEKVEVLEFSSSVRYSDLDLRLVKDVAELKRRVDTAAKDVCEDLADKKPPLREPDPTCIRNAVESATKELDEIVAAAN